MHGERKNTCKVSAGKPEGKSPLLKCRRRWEDDIKTVFRETGLDCMDWIHMTQDRDKRRAIVNMIVNFVVP
jgi:hypothetical protein